MKELSATDASRNFSDLLDAVEHDKESFVVVRQGRPVARIDPIVQANGAQVKALLRRLPRDPTWERELRELRAMLNVEERAWND